MVSEHNTSPCTDALLRVLEITCSHLLFNAIYSRLGGNKSLIQEAESLGQGDVRSGPEKKPRGEKHTHLSKMSLGHVVTLFALRHCNHFHCARKVVLKRCRPKTGENRFGQAKERQFIVKGHNVPLTGLPGVRSLCSTSEEKSEKKAVVTLMVMTSCLRNNQVICKHVLSKNR